MLGTIPTTKPSLAPSQNIKVQFREFTYCNDIISQEPTKKRQVGFTLKLVCNQPLITDAMQWQMIITMKDVSDIVTVSGTLIYASQG